MKKINTKIKDLVLIKTNIFKDNRGFFKEVERNKILKKKFIFDCFSFSKKNTLRGLHLQKKNSQAKIITVVQGEILDVVVDLRKNSNTYGKHFSIKISQNSNFSLFIPENFAHGFLCLSKNVSKNITLEKNYGLHKFETYKKFSRNVLNSKNKLNQIFKVLKSKKKKIIGYGATAKSCTVLNYCKIQKNSIDFFYDTTSFKINKYLPGSKIKIKKYKKLSRNDADFVFLGAWNFQEEIFKKENQFIKNGGKFITHIPFPKII